MNVKGRIVTWSGKAAIMIGRFLYRDDRSGSIGSTEAFVVWSNYRTAERLTSGDALVSKRAECRTGDVFYERISQTSPKNLCLARLTLASAEGSLSAPNAELRRFGNCNSSKRKHANHNSRCDEVMVLDPD